MAERQIIELAGRFAIRCSELHTVQAVYLYGLHCGENSPPECDIEVAVFLGTPADRYEVQTSLLNLRRKFYPRIEPCVFLPHDCFNSNPAVAEILERGILISGQPPVIQ